MNNEHFQKVLSIMRRTGDKGFVIDSQSDDMFMLMNISDYEKMLDRIDSPGIGPRSEEDDEMEDYVLDDIIEIEERGKTDAPAAETKIIPEIQKAEAGQKLNFSEGWAETKPELVEKTEVQHPLIKEESLKDVPHEDGEEEKFYLEPVE